MEYSQQSAGIIFTAATVLLGISIVLIKSTWKYLSEIFKSLPIEKWKIHPLSKLKEIEDKNEQNKELKKNMLWISIFLLAGNIFLNIFSMICIAALLMGLNIGIEQTARDNFNGARYMMFVSPMLLFIAVSIIGAFRFRDLIAMKTGKRSPSIAKKNK